MFFRSDVAFGGNYLSLMQKKFWKSGDDFRYKRNELQFELLILSAFAAFIKSINCVCSDIGGICDDIGGGGGCDSREVWMKPVGHADERRAGV